jgi:hypothetical protein
MRNILHNLRKGKHIMFSANSAQKCYFFMIKRAKLPHFQMGKKLLEILLNLNYREFGLSIFWLRKFTIFFRKEGLWLINGFC